MTNQPHQGQSTVVNVTLSGARGVHPAIAPKSLGRALALCLCFGAIGAHRFYLRRTHAKTMLILWLIGLATAVIGGVLLMAATWIWSIIDLFSLSTWVREFNARAADGLLPTSVTVQTPTLQPELQPQLPAAKPVDLPILLLRESQKRDGRLTVNQAVSATGRSFDEVTECLNKMVDKGYVDVDNLEGSGVVVYIFGE